MPEGPEVRKIANVIELGVPATFLGAQIVQQPGFKHKYVRNGIENFHWIQNQIWSIVEVEVRGKLIVLWCQNKKGKFAILNTLGMAGTWSWNQPGHSHARVDFIGRKHLTYMDARSFGTIKIVTVVEAVKKLQKIGHDLLQSPMPAQAWAELRDAKRVKGKPIAEVLMDQRLFSGVGNIYKAEILYALKIKPDSIVDQIPLSRWMMVNYTAHEILQRSYQYGGSTVQTYKAGGQEGAFQRQLMIYRKESCPGCKGVVEASEHAKRTTWWCPTCQYI